jgi:hypothetical protein
MRIRVLGLAVMIVASAAVAQAQPVKFEVEAGATFAQVPDFGEAVEDIGLETSVLTRVTVGAGVVVPFNRRLFLRPSVTFVQKGFELSGGEMGIPVGARLHADFVEIPVLFGIQLVEAGRVSPFVVAGPTLGFNTRASMTGSVLGMQEDIDLDDEIRDTEIGIAVGGGVTFGYFKVEGRYTQGLTDVLEEAGPRGAPVTRELHTRTLALTFGVRF